MVKYSVLIPAYNAAAFLEECVRSVLLQDGYPMEWILQEVEILIADDGSTDNTLDICKQLARDFKNISYYHKENEGQLLTREFLFKQANGEYILNLDADDTWEPILIKTIENSIMQEPSADMVIFSFNLWTKEKKEPYSHNESCEHIKEQSRIIQKILSTDNYNSLWSKAIRREVVQKALYPDHWRKIRRGEDKLQTMACLENCESVLWISDALYNYRIDNTSMTRSFKPEYFEDVLFVDREVFAVLCKHTGSNDASIVRWAETLLKKLNDFIIAAYENLPDPQNWIRKYQSTDIMQRAIKTLINHGSVRQRINAVLIQYRLYRMLRLYFTVKK